MSYFQARVGPPISGGVEVRDQGSEIRDRDSGIRDPVLANWGRGPMSYFTACIGPHPGATDGDVSERNASKRRAPRFESGSPKAELICPLCRGALRREDGLYRCTGRCRTRWVEEWPGHLVDVASLPLGICGCCEGPQALVAGESGAVCPTSGREYLLLPEGPVPRELGAPLGLCRCCVPPMPLGEQDDQLVCRAKPFNRYERVGDQVRLILPSGGPDVADTLEAIDAALSQNSARLSLYGLFDLEE